MPSKISWTEETWNPVTGCSKVSPGCAHCYAETISLRFGSSAKPWLPQHAADNVVLHPERLTLPLCWKKPRMVFVNSMSDLFHENVADEFIDRVFAVMALTPWHIFQVLTKRPERMLLYMTTVGRDGRIAQAMDTLRTPVYEREEWRPITHYPGYFVSTLGRIASEKRGERYIMRPDAGEQGYQRVQLHREGGARYGDRLLVHRLTLEAFVGPPPSEDSQACHLDGNPGNNRVVNLRYGQFRAYSKLTEAQVHTIRRRGEAGGSAYAIAKDCSVSDTQIRNIIRGAQWATEPGVKLPLSHCWLGVSVENQRWADERIPLLLETPAAVRFLSCEPLLAPIDLTKWLGGTYENHPTSGRGGLSSGSGRDARNRLSGQSMEERSPSRAQDRLRIPPGQGNAAGEESARVGSSSGLQALLWADTGGHDGKPQERPEGRQSAYELRNSYLSRADTAHYSGVRASRLHSPKRRDEPSRETDQSAGLRDKSAQGDGREVDQHSAGLRPQLQDGLQNRSRAEMGIHWVICGGESGQHMNRPQYKHRWMKPEWAQDIVDQCRAAGTPVWFKQGSGLRPGMAEDLLREKIQEWPRNRGSQWA